MIDVVASVIDARGQQGSTRLPTGNDPKLRMIAIYAAAGEAEFAIQAWLLARRPHEPVSAVAT